jgi:hypothetical protein
MAKKKTKKTGAKPVGDARTQRGSVEEELRQLDERIAERSLRTVRVCVELLDTLDCVLDTADFAFSTDPARKDGVLDFDEVHTLDIRLWEVENRLALVELEESFDPLATPRDAIKALRKMLAFSGKAHTITDPADTIARGIRAVEILRDFELVRARGRCARRAPVGVERSTLRILLASTIALDAGAVAAKIGTHRDPAADKTVWDAVSRLRSECAYEIEKTGAGYRLTPRDRALARDDGISGEAVGVEAK